MSLLLCRQENVRRPYYMEALGIHLYSSQELAYVIFNHPLLVMDSFIDERLLDFLRDELNLGFLALKIDRYLKGGGSTDDVLVMILLESDYYNGNEVGRFRQLVKNFRSRHPAEYGKIKADELFSMRQYGRAEEIYRELLDTPRDHFVNDAFLGKVWFNLGSCYARMFKMEKAMDAFERSYFKAPQKLALEQMVILTMLDGRLKLSERIQTQVDGDIMTRCEERSVAAREKAVRSASVQELDNLFAGEKEKRLEGEKVLIKKWKNDYRYQL